MPKKSNIRLIEKVEPELHQAAIPNPESSKTAVQDMNELKELVAKLALEIKKQPGKGNACRPDYGIMIPILFAFIAIIPSFLIFQTDNMILIGIYIIWSFIICIFAAQRVYEVYNAKKKTA